MGYYLEVIPTQEDDKELKYCSAEYTIDVNDDGSIEIYDKVEGVWYKAENANNGKSYTFYPMDNWRPHEVRFYMSSDYDPCDHCTYTFSDMKKYKNGFDVNIDLKGLKDGDVTRVGSVYPISGDYTCKYIIYNSLAETKEKEKYRQREYRQREHSWNWLRVIGRLFFWYLIIASIYILITDPTTFFGDIVDQPAVFIIATIGVIILYIITKKKNT